ncbi:hypothetical protein DUI87_04106 [Hirundo rustica rustica]|uniref:Uncharacterized protein n=1 Tax=Hirundo rustica rustica TaxID=333673 RepID=A0A3M0L6A7_HIRRU|nr:hypothetical protein DUI87_04106 [Hirundo rustica rustica]
MGWKDSPHLARTHPRRSQLKPEKSLWRPVLLDCPNSTSPEHLRVEKGQRSSGGGNLGSVKRGLRTMAEIPDLINNPQEFLGADSLPQFPCLLAADAVVLCGCHQQNKRFPEERCCGDILASRVPVEWKLVSGDMHRDHDVIFIINLLDCHQIKAVSAKIPYHEKNAFTFTFSWEGKIVFPAAVCFKSTAAFFLDMNTPAEVVTQAAWPDPLQAFENDQNYPEIVLKREECQDNEFFRAMLPCRSFALF